MFPTPHTVEHAVAVKTGENALGQTQLEYVTRSRAVYGWRTTSVADDRSADLAERVITEVSLATPDGDWHDGDLVTLPGQGQFVVHGGVHDCNNGPFGFAPGYRVTLRKVTDGPA